MTMVVVYLEGFDTYNLTQFSGTDGWESGYGEDAWSTGDSSANDVFSSTSDHGGSWGTDSALDNHLIYTLRQFSDLTLEADAQIGSEGSIGLVFRYQDDQNYYLVAFGRGGRLPAAGSGNDTNTSGGRLLKVENGIAQQLANTTSTLDDGLVTISIVGDGPTIDVYLDQVAVMSASDSTFTHGPTGLFCYDAAEECRFDFLRVKVPDIDADGDGLRASEDCDDTDPAIHPGDATHPAPSDDTCDGIDQDCDGIADQDATELGEYWVDVDQDGFGGGDSQFGCPPPDSAPFGGDCNDENPGVNPEGTERCDDEDNDCDGVVDDDPIDPVWYYPDADDDDFPDQSVAAIVGCDAPPDRIAEREDGLSDCDDSDNTIHPGAPETAYDDIDQDCDGFDLIDADFDGVPVGEDCDDADAARAPGNDEIAEDGVDQDCSGFDATFEIGGGCSGCATSTGPSLFPIILGVLGLARRRRHS